MDRRTKNIIMIIILVSIIATESYGFRFANKIDERLDKIENTIDEIETELEKMNDRIEELESYHTKTLKK